MISELEHPSIQAAADRLESLGVDVTRLCPGADGVVEADSVAAALRPDTRLVLAGLMLANNELGTVQPVAEAALACRARGVRLLCDAVQAAGKLAIDAGALGADYLVVAAHKFNGPGGAAAFRIREGAAFEPLILGGGQERRRRAGTENVAALVGFGACAALASEELDGRIERLSRLREGLEAGLAGFPDARLHCASSPRLPHVTHVAFPGLIGEELVVRLDLAGFAVSTGAACASGVVEPSRTLLAMGVEAAEALASIRISLGTTNDEAGDRPLPAGAGARSGGAAPVPLTAVAMSGGLDSSVAALLLERHGTPVVGLSMLLWDRSQQVRHGRCCGSLDLGDARRVAEQIGLPHYTLRMDGEFRRHVVRSVRGQLR